MLPSNLPHQGLDAGANLASSLDEIALAIITLIAGYIIVRIIAGRLMASFEKGMNIPRIMAGNLVRAIRLFLYLIVILLALSFLHVDVDAIMISIAAFIAFVLGFGMQDTINNLASGIWISAAKAYDIDDEVDIAGHYGVVIGMNIMSTEIKKLDNSRVIIPNGKIWNNAITNVSKMPVRMLVVDYGVAYGTPVDEAIRVALEVAATHPRLHKEPAPIVRFREMADSAVILQLRAWVDTDWYYPVKSEVLTALYNELRGAGIEIPFPQVDVHMRDS
ncbi:MAG: mechanosensitive ion channel family protein [Methanomicrobiales archaeon]